MQIKKGEIIEGKVTGITPFGVFVSFDGGSSGMVHISEVSKTYVKDINDFVKMNDIVKVKVLDINESGKISLSISKAAEPQKTSEPKPRFKKAPANVTLGGRADKELSFEEMLSKFKQDSDDKLSDFKRVESRRGVGNKKSKR